MSHFRQALGLAVLLALASTAGCARKQQQGQFKMPPMPVETATVARETLAERFTALGTLEAAEQVTVVSEIDGQIENLPFREGAEIQRGGLIAQLDDAQLAAELQRAEALRDQASAAWGRVRTLVEQRAGAPQDLDDAVAAFKVAEANVALAGTRLAKTRIAAPFAGVTGARRVSVGHFLRSGDAIVDLARLDELRVNFSAPESYLGRLRKGAPVTVTAPAFPDVTLRGAIDVIEPIVDAATRSARIVARVPNPERLLRPGMSADVSVVLSEHAGALVVPSEAVFAQGAQPVVYVVKPDSTVAPVTLTLGLRTPQVVEVTAGLQDGDVVVRAGHQKLFPGAKVMPIASGAAPGADSGDQGAPPAQGEAR